MTTIVQKEDPVLREKAVEVPKESLSSARIVRIIKAMQQALESQADGVAIAAPQIGENLRIFIVSKRAFQLQGEKSEELNESPAHDLVFINPRLMKLSRKKEWVEEGCLSVRWLYGHVQRSVKASVRAYDERGKIFERGGSGILAQIFQHEMDHLDGMLFIDKAKDIREVLPEES